MRNRSGAAAHQGGADQCRVLHKLGRVYQMSFIAAGPFVGAGNADCRHRQRRKQRNGDQNQEKDISALVVLVQHNKFNTRFVN